MKYQTNTHKCCSKAQTLQHLVALAESLLNEVCAKCTYQMQAGGGEHEACGITVLIFSKWQFCTMCITMTNTKDSYAYDSKQY